MRQFLFIILTILLSCNYNQETKKHFDKTDTTKIGKHNISSVNSQNTDTSKTEIIIPAGGQETIEMQRLALQSKTTLQLIQGLWYHDQDSLATLTIKQKLWTFNYKGEQAELNDSYSIAITDKLPEYVKETENAEFLILTNKTDTLQYEILGLTDTTFSLMYFPAGKIHLYKRHR